MRFEFPPNFIRIFQCYRPQAWLFHFFFSPALSISWIHKVPSIDIDIDWWIYWTIDWCGLILIDINWYWLILIDIDWLILIDWFQLCLEVFCFHVFSAGHRKYGHLPPFTNMVHVLAIFIHFVSLLVLYGRGNTRCLSGKPRYIHSSLGLLTIYARRRFLRFTCIFKL